MPRLLDYVAALAVGTGAATASDHWIREAPLTGQDGLKIGAVQLADGRHGMVVRVQAGGIGEGFHGVHLHEVGDCSDAAAGFKASGGHIDIAGNQHGLLNPDGYHVGADFPNVYAGLDGHLGAELFAAGLRLEQADDSDGFALVIHAREDDHKTQPIGGAGARIACAAFD